MNYDLEVQKSLPNVYNALNGSSVPLVAGSGSGTLLSTTPTTVTFNGWVVNRERSAFTAEVWYLPVTVSAETVVLGHTGEGVLFNGTDFILRIKYSGSTIEARWTPDQVQNFYLALVYTTTSWILYANGERVISLDAPIGVPLTNATTTISLNSGTGTGVYDCLALYYRTLTSDDIKSHYSIGRSVMSSRDIATAKRGYTWNLTYDAADTGHRVEIDLASGHTENTAFGNGQLVALDATGGTWFASIPTAAITEGTTTAGLNVTYVGRGATIDYSVDGSTWVNTPNKATILQDVTPPAMLYLRITLANDLSWVSSLRVDQLRSRTLAPMTGPRQLTFYNASLDQTPGMQLDYQADAGADLHSGSLIIGLDPSTTPQPISTTEMWMKINSLSVGLTFLDGQLADNVTGTGWIAYGSGGLDVGGGTLYINGVPKPSGTTLSPGTWYHIVFVETSPANMNSYIGVARAGGIRANMTVGHIAQYTQAMSATDVAHLYALNVGAPALRIDDSGTIGVTESAPAIDIYAYTWSIISAGR